LERIRTAALSMHAPTLSSSCDVPMSRVHDVVLADRRVDEVQQRIKEQKARLQRMIVQGFPSQSDDDLLSKLYVNLVKLQQGRRTIGD
jgi:hypothetical protein